ncbi:MAG: hypothetical protein RI894_946 [Bacteroidota bacterium]|jgi:cytochrome c
MFFNNYTDYRKRYQKKMACILLILSTFVAFNACVSTDPNPYKGGGLVYKNACADCHGDKGEGLFDLVPPLANSDYLASHQNQLLHIIKKGLDTSLIVNGKKYSQPMPPQLLNDVQLVNVINFINHEWGNNQPDRLLKEVQAELKLEADKR